MLRKCLLLLCVLVLLPVGALTDAARETLVGKSYEEVEQLLGAPVYHEGLSWQICVWHIEDRVVVCTFRSDGTETVLTLDTWKAHKLVSEYVVLDRNKKWLEGSVEPELDARRVIRGLKTEDPAILARSVDVGSGFTFPAMISSDGMIVINYGLFEMELRDAFTLLPPELLYHLTHGVFF